MAKNASLSLRVARLLTDEARRLGLSHSEMARTTGLSQPTIGRILKGTTSPDLGALLLLLAVLGRSLVWLDLAGIKPPPCELRCTTCGTEWVTPGPHCIACHGKRQELRVDDYGIA